MKRKFKIRKDPFGFTNEGDAIIKYTISDGTGLEMSVLNYGGIITSLMMPDKNQDYGDIVLGFDSYENYLENEPYFGAIIGRYANRIANGRFSIDGELFELEVNDGSNHLHGGIRGFDKVIWDIQTITEDGFAVLTLTYLSMDGENGYPGNLKTTVKYTLSADCILDVEYQAVTDKKTIINFTQHSYFNLSGDFNSQVIDHVIMINADHFLPVNSNLIPTGEIRAVKQTPFDFTTPTEIKKSLEEGSLYKQLKWDPGFNHCWKLNNDERFGFAASAYHSESGRFLEVFTDTPGLQFYLGNCLNGSLPAKGSGNYEKRTGFCMETQYYPNSPNEPKFPSVILNTGKEYYSKTSFHFSVKGLR